MQLIEGRLLQLAAIEWGKDILICSSALNRKTKTLLSAIWEKGLIVQAYLGGFQQPSNAGRVFKPV